MIINILRTNGGDESECSTWEEFSLILLLASMSHTERRKGGRREELKSEEVTRGRTVHKNSSESLKLGKSNRMLLSLSKKT